MSKPESATKPGLLVLAPLRFEARAVSGRSGPSTVVARTGSGPARAGPRARALAEAPHPEAVAVAGVAGALIPDLTPGTIVVADRIIDQHGQPLACLESAGADRFGPAAAGPPGGGGDGRHL